MNYRTVFMGTMAILVAALIMDLPIVSATQINIMYWNGAQWIKWDDVSISNENFIDKSVSIVNIGGIFWSNAKVIINVTNNTISDLEAVHVYRCKGLSPGECVETETPETHTILDNDFDMELVWNDVSQVVTSCSSSPNSCFEYTNILLLFRVNDDGKTVWTGLWDKVERRTRSFAEPYLSEHATDQVDVRAGSLDFVSPIRDFLVTYLTVPFNPDWVSGVVFTGANTLYEISASSSDLQNPSPVFSVSNYTGDEITGISDYYSFVFPESSSDVFSPVTLNLNPSFTCGLYDCEADKGESYSTCCYDCPCSSGFYCDGGTGGSCRQENAISLSLYEPPLTAIENCNEQHTINVTAEINYAPSDKSLTKSEYVMNGTTYSTQCEEILDNVYRCLITVPAVPDCQAGEYTMGPNYLSFTISYSDGPNQKSKDLTVGFPDIVVGSYTCGQDGCETGLGENSGNCCYDCGCPQGYCDIANSGQPSTGTCRQDITVSDLWVTADPTHFNTYNTGGENMRLIIEIRNAPKSLEITNSLCSIDCSYGSYTCSASCDVSCSETASDPDKYNAECIVTFIVSNYDNQNDYTLEPTLNISVTYNNGSSGKVNKEFKRAFSTISIGSNWCGDMICGPDESKDSCCYDCGCYEGYFCDTVDADAPTTGDSCKSESSIMLIIDGLSESEFDGHGVSHNTTLMAHVNNAPSSLSGELSCTFGDGTGPSCNINCVTIADAFTHTLQCKLGIPIIDYKTSPFFDPETRKLVIGPNTLAYSTTFNDGSGAVSKDLSAGFPNIVVDVKPSCGSGAGYLGVGEEYCTPFNRTAACETDLGEDWTTCCCDCPCPDEQYCHLSGTDDPGTCKDVGSISLTIESLEPDPMECQIMPPEPERNNCIFTKPQLFATVRIEPEADYTSTGAYFKIDGNKKDATCIPDTDEPPFNVFKCSSRMQNIKRENPMNEGTEEKHVTIDMSIASTGLLDATVSAQGDFNLKREKSDALKSIEEQMAEFDDVLDRLEGKKRTLKIIMAIIWIVCAFACWWSLGTACQPCVAFAICVSVDLLLVIRSLNSAIESVKQAIELLDRASTPVDMYAQQLEVHYGAAEGLMTVTRGIGCMLAYGGGFGASSSTATGSSSYF